MTLGEYLRQERLKKGFTIEQVASATKISVRLLHLLEDDRYSELPAKPFIRGFVNSYAKFVGLETKDLFEKFGEFLEEKSKERPSRESGHSGYAFEKRESEQSHLILWSAVVGIGVIGLVLVFIFKPSSKRHHRHQTEEVVRTAEPSPIPFASLAPVTLETPAVATNEQPAPKPTQAPVQATAPVQAQAPVQASAPAPVPTQVPAPASPPAPAEKPDPLQSGVNLTKDQIAYRVVIKALADQIVRYKVDDRKFMKFILRKDKVLVLRAQSKMQFQALNPEQVLISGSGASKILSEHQSKKDWGGVPTLVLAKDGSESIQDELSRDGKLSGPVPQSRATPSGASSDAEQKRESTP